MAACCGKKQHLLVARKQKSHTKPTQKQIPKMTTRPRNVGIKASYVHFPSTFVSQAKLEQFDGVSAGKYTTGLGQEQMGFCGPREDTTSLMMTAVSELLTRYGLSYKDIGRLEVGTESLVDKSKSAKTSLMRMFKENTSLEGVTSINACYGGTAALFHTADWVESSAWDGRYGLVVCGDVAVYERGPARPTGGAGVVAMLIGPDAPLVLESSMRSTHMEDVYDFYKPNMESEYPIVDGKLSTSCFLRSVDVCLARYAEKFERLQGKKFSLQDDIQHCVFHLPYTKLVQKSFGRMQFADEKRIASPSSPFAPYFNLDDESSYANRDLEKLALQRTAQDYQSKVFPSTLAGRRLGNLYTGSVYAGLASLIASSQENAPEFALGKRALMFSYGSGLAASLFSLRINGSLEEQRKVNDLMRRLDSRVEATAEEYTQAMLLREKEWCRPASQPTPHAKERLLPGEYYLAGVDALHRRTYAQVPPRAAAAVQQQAVRAMSTLARRLL